MECFKKPVVNESSKLNQNCAQVKQNQENSKHFLKNANLNQFNKKSFKKIFKIKQNSLKKKSPELTV